MRSRMWSMPPSYATPTSTRLYQSVIENTAYLQGCDCAHMHGLCLCRPWVEQFDKHLDWRGLDRGPRARRNDCQLAACDESDPLLDTDGFTACKFASRGISSGAVAAQSIRHSGLLRPSTEKCAIWRTNWRTTCDDVSIDDKHISLADGGWGQTAEL